MEAEQTLVEHQLRELVDKPDLNKSVEEQQEEEYLINKLLDIVNQRSHIVDSMDEDRIRLVPHEHVFIDIVNQRNNTVDSIDEDRIR